MKRIYALNLLSLVTHASDIETSQVSEFLSTAVSSNRWGLNQPLRLTPEFVSNLPIQAQAQGLNVTEILEEEKREIIETQKTQYLLTAAVWTPESELTPEQREGLESRQITEVVEYKTQDEVWVDQLEEDQESLGVREITVQEEKITPAVTREMVEFPREYVFWEVDVTAEYQAMDRSAKNKETREFLFGIVDMLKDANTASGITSEQTLAFVNDARISNCMKLILANSFKALHDYVAATDFTGLFNESQKSYVLSALVTFASSKGIQL